MERDRERDLREILRKLSDSWHDSTARYRDTSTREIKFFLVAHDLDRSFYIAIVQKRLSHSHKDDISEFFVLLLEMMYREHNLIDNLIELKISDESELPSRTKTASHRTSDLTADTECISS